MKTSQTVLATVLVFNVFVVESFCFQESSNATVMNIQIQRTKAELNVVVSGPRGTQTFEMSSCPPDMAAVPAKTALPAQEQPAPAQTGLAPKTTYPISTREAEKGSDPLSEAPLIQPREEEISPEIDPATGLPVSFVGFTKGINDMISPDSLKRFSGPDNIMGYLNKEVLPLILDQADYWKDVDHPGIILELQKTFRNTLVVAKSQMDREEISNENLKEFTNLTSQITKTMTNMDRILKRENARQRLLVLEEAARNYQNEGEKIISESREAVARIDKAILTPLAKPDNPLIDEKAKRLMRDLLSSEKGIATSLLQRSITQFAALNGIWLKAQKEFLDALEELDDNDKASLIAAYEGLGEPPVRLLNRVDEALGRLNQSIKTAENKIG